METKGGMYHLLGELYRTVTRHYMHLELCMIMAGGVVPGSANRNGHHNIVAGRNRAG